jgi:hypothetical protein
MSTNSRPAKEGIDEVAFTQLANEAVQAMSELLHFPEDWSDRDVQRGKLSSTILSNFTKHEQTQSSRLAVGFAMAREMSQSPDELRSLVTRALPAAPVAEILSADAAG